MSRSVSALAIYPPNLLADSVHGHRVHRQGPHGSAVHTAFDLLISITMSRGFLQMTRNAQPKL